MPTWEWKCLIFFVWGTKNIKGLALNYWVFPNVRSFFNSSYKMHSLGLSSPFNWWGNWDVEMLRSHSKWCLLSRMTNNAGGSRNPSCLKWFSLPQDSVPKCTFCIWFEPILWAGREGQRRFTGPHPLCFLYSESWISSDLWPWFYIFSMVLDVFNPTYNISSNTDPCIYDF